MNINLFHQINYNYMKQTTSMSREHLIQIHQSLTTDALNDLYNMLDGCAFE